MGLRWKIRLGLIAIGVVWAILDSEWKTIDEYFPKLNEVIHSGTPTSEGDMDYLEGRLQQDMQSPTTHKSFPQTIPLFEFPSYPSRIHQRLVPGNDIAPFNTLVN